MSTAITKTQKELKKMLNDEGVQQRLQQCLGKRSNQFATSMLSLVGQDDMLAEAQPSSILQSAMTAATLDLPIQKDLGFAWIIAYRDNKNNRTLAQFQMGYKGFIQLAYRTGQYSRMNAEVITEGAYKGKDEVGEPVIDWDAISEDKPTIGYAFAFKLTNGFSKIVYWPKEKIEKHAKRYSQAYRKNYGPWKDDFDGMALKTVIKNTLSKWGVLSVEMQQAISADQQAGGEYSDNRREDAATARNAEDLKGKLQNVGQDDDVIDIGVDQSGEQKQEQPEEKPTASSLTKAKAAELLGVPEDILMDYCHSFGASTWVSVDNATRQEIIERPQKVKGDISKWQEEQDNQ